MRAGPIVVVLALALSACGATPRGSMDVASPEANARAEAEVRAVLDAWHLAAAESNEEAYFARMTEDAIFLGTDATERWNRQQFQEYAHRPFSEGRGWRMRAIRRDVAL